MNIESLEDLPANRAVIEELYSDNLLTRQAHEFALNLLYPNKNWAKWVAYFLLTVGTSLVLSGIIYFFAFNWEKLTTLMKFTAIEVAIVLCLLAAYVLTLQQLIGKLFLTAAAILIGVFLAVFGQIYQSGADPYLLFTMWTILIAIWVFIARFAALWIIWAIILQLAVGLYWEQAVHATYEWEIIIFSILALINLVFLIAREYGYLHGATWLQSNWTRILLISATLFFLLIAPLNIIGHFSTTEATLIGSLLCCLIYLALFYYYRYQQPDLQVLSGIVIAICILVEFLMFRISIEAVNGSLVFLWMSIFSLMLFTLSVVTLRKIALTMENNHV